MSYIGEQQEQGRVLTNGELTNSLLVSKSGIRERFGEKTNAFIAKFTTPAFNANSDFTDPFALNAVAIAPILDLGEHLYVPIQYRLFQSIYESPFYWMMADRTYKDTAAKHRGDFLEKTTIQILARVFGRENIFENVKIRDGSKNIAAEADVIVAYGEFVLIIQAKSKRVTQKARAGDPDALKADFEGAIQSPYRQALKCVELIRKGAECVTIEGKILSLPVMPRLFPVVVLSDPFPAATFLSRTMLERGNHVAPVIWDLGVLDCIARLMPSPVEMIFYLKCRSEIFEKVHSDSENNFLGYHIRVKLSLPDDVDWVLLETDLATVVDDFMITADLGVEAERPIGVLERLSIPIVSDILATLKAADPTMVSVAIDLYDFSSEALNDMSTRMLEIRNEIAATGKAIKALSVPTANGGLTYSVTQKLDGKAFAAAELIGRKHKHDTKSDRWYVILDAIETEHPIDGLIPLVWPWKESEEETENSEKIAELFKSSKEEAVVGESANSTFQAKKRPQTNQE